MYTVFAALTLAVAFTLNELEFIPGAVLIIAAQLYWFCAERRIRRRPPRARG